MCVWNLVSYHTAEEMCAPYWCLCITNPYLGGKFRVRIVRNRGLVLSVLWGKLRLDEQILHGKATCTHVYRGNKLGVSSTLRRAARAAMHSYMQWGGVEGSSSLRLYHFSRHTFAFLDSLLNSSTD